MFKVYNNLTFRIPNSLYKSTTGNKFGLLKINLSSEFKVFPRF